MRVMIPDSLITLDGLLQDGVSGAGILFSNVPRKKSNRKDERPRHSLLLSPERKRGHSRGWDGGGVRGRRRRGEMKGGTGRNLAA